MIVSDPVAPRGERIKVLDFGIAKLAETNAIPADSTKSNLLMGTPRYMSPEQCRGAGKVDAKADVYSLGIILYQVLAGHLPFDSNAPGELIVMHITEAPPPLREAAPELPPHVISLIEAMLTKAAAARPAMGEVALALQQYLRQLEGPASSPLMVIAPPASDLHAPATVPMQSLRSYRQEAAQQPVSEPPAALTITAGSSTLGQSIGQSVSQPGGLERRRRPYLYAVPALLVVLGIGLVAKLSFTSTPTPPAVSPPATAAATPKPAPSPALEPDSVEPPAPKAVSPVKAAPAPKKDGSQKERSTPPAASPAASKKSPPASVVKPSAASPPTGKKNPQRKPKVEKSLFDNID